MSSIATRLVRNHQTWNAWKYQERGVAHLIQNHAAALFWDPGLGKTAVVLEAFRLLLEHGQAWRMLVVAPLRVCQLVWRQEAQRWTQFRGLTFSLLHGPKKAERLQDDVDIHLINPEGIDWLSKQFYGRTDLPWDVVTIDELTRFKHQRTARHKRLRAKIQRARYRWGLTGSPIPNGYMDLFGQMLMLDDGAALGRYVTYFRDQYFTLGWDGFTYSLREGAAARIEAKIAPYVLRMSAADYLELPPLVTHRIDVHMPEEAKKQYKELRKEMIISLPEGVVTAANSAAVYSKLKQFTNGAVYISRDRTDFAEVHDAKLAALEELIEELAGQPVLVAYEFQSDLARIRARIGEDTPTLTGLTEKKIVEVEAKWNRGEIPVLLVHPASAGHGLNLQGAGAAHVCWFSRPWDLELYDQTIRRVYRQGSTAARVVNHVLHVPDTIDDVVDEALRDKDVTQQRLLKALNATLTDGGEMALKKLGFKEETAAAAPVASPRGWGSAAPTPDGQQQQESAPAKPRGWGSPGGTEPDPQRAAIAGKLQGNAEPSDDEDEGEEPASARALAAFPSNIVQGLTGGTPPGGAIQPPGWGAAVPVEEVKAAEPEKPARSRRKAAEPVASPETAAKASVAPLGDASSQNQALQPIGVGSSAGYYPQPPVFRIEFYGVSQRAAAAALAALSATMIEEG